MSNKGTYTLSLGNLCRWLAGQAEALGVEIFPGFAAAEVLFNEDGSVKGVATGDMGVARDGTHKPDYQPGMELHGRYTFFAEGARGHLTKELKRIFDLDASSRAAGLRHRPQGTVGRRSGQARAGPRHPHPGLAARRTPGAAASSTTRTTTRSPSASSSRSTTAIPICRRSRNSSAGSSIRRSASSSRAAGASAMARGRSTRAAGSRCRSSPSRAAR